MQPSRSVSFRPLVIWDPLRVSDAPSETRRGVGRLSYTASQPTGGGSSADTGQMRSYAAPRRCRNGRGG